VEERSRSEIAAIAAGFMLGAAVVIVWKRSAPRHVPAPMDAPSPAAAPVAPAAPESTSGIMESALVRLAGVAVSHGRDDPAVDLFLAFVGALDPSPDPETLMPAARLIGELRLAQALDRPDREEARLGARRLLGAVSAEPQVPAASGLAPARAGTVTVERTVDTVRRLPGLVEALLQAVRGALNALF
jgi:hypothetical protein